MACEGRCRLAVLCRVASPLRPNSARLSSSWCCLSMGAGAGLDTRSVAVNTRLRHIHLSPAVSEAIHRAVVRMREQTYLIAKLRTAVVVLPLSLLSLLCGGGDRVPSAHACVGILRGWRVCNNPHRNRGGQKQTDGARRDCALGTREAGNCCRSLRLADNEGANDIQGAGQSLTRDS
ncbi:hypothetical protein K505DRAFT_418583 [Melanomma pulvis-pyrius CBS 109.77]|uniref:Uncharacterized protein n=1 Tax=Melanomma pulvis-pyrius CBS 109.77 TaxID=1314802 RepID=A0A6A6X7A8_9PLEO|nr:hypothetical protein K505DRAFT_418583 [Melanomma pulvis-pyrius CBS 109.77]